MSTSSTTHSFGTTDVRIWRCPMDVGDVGSVDHGARRKSCLS